MGSISHLAIYIKAKRMVLDAAHETSSERNVLDMPTHPDKSDWPSKGETAVHDAKLKKQLGGVGVSRAEKCPHRRQWKTNLR
jgi:hypothetical protein